MDTTLGMTALATAATEPLGRVDREAVLCGRVVPGLSTDVLLERDARR